MHKVAEVNLEEITQPTELFNQPDDLNPTEIAGIEITPDENHQENGASPSHITQPSSPHSPLTDASVAPYEHLLRPCIDVKNIICPESMADHPEVIFKADNYALYGV